MEEGKRRQRGSESVGRKTAREESAEERAPGGGRAGDAPGGARKRPLGKGRTATPMATARTRAGNRHPRLSAQSVSRMRCAHAA